MCPTQSSFADWSPIQVLSFVLLPERPDSDWGRFVQGSSSHSRLHFNLKEALDEWLDGILIQWIRTWENSREMVRDKGLMCTVHGSQQRVEPLVERLNNMMNKCPIHSRASSL